MAEGKLISHHDEAIVLRTWAFHEADLLVSLFTREQGRVKGVARHAMKSRRRFGGALEPATHVRAHFTERPRQDLVRLDSFEVLWSPLTAPVDYLRTAGLQLVVEVVEEALPELAPEDNVFRLVVAVLKAMEGAGNREQGAGSREQGKGNAEQAAEIEPAHDAMKPRDEWGTQTMCASEEAIQNVWLPVTYFCLWMNRLMGWMPELGHCSVCGLDLRGETVWWSAAADGVTCRDDCHSGSHALSAEGVRESYAMARTPLPQMLTEGDWPRGRAADLRVFAVGLLERHLERRLRSAAALT